MFDLTTPPVTMIYFVNMNVMPLFLRMEIKRHQAFFFTPNFLIVMGTDTLKCKADPLEYTI